VGGRQLVALNNSVSTMEDDKKEAVKINQKYYKLGRYVEFLQEDIRKFYLELRGKLDRRSEEALETVRDATCSLQNLDCSITHQIMEDVDYLAVLQEWNRIFDQVQIARQVYKK
jgi:hypothetical protein